MQLKILFQLFENKFYRPAKLVYQSYFFIAYVPVIGDKLTHSAFFVPLCYFAQAKRLLLFILFV
jgi:hypothetical protein